MKLDVRDVALTGAEEDRVVFLSRLRIAAMFFATPLVLSFSAIDYFMFPNHWKEFLLARLFVMPVCFCTVIAYKIEFFSKRFWVLPSIPMALFLGVYHAYLVAQTGYEDSPYYAGINLGAIISFSFLPWPPRYIPLLLAATYLPYFGVILSAERELNLMQLMTNSAFMFSTCFLSVGAYLITRDLRRKELKSRIDLESQNAHQAAEIVRRTNEGIYLEKLTSQFSPQIVEGVKSGDLHLDKRSRREVTCIFIDVENSTQRSNRIDYSTYSNLLSEFFSECVDIFLRHDVTVGTYLGDGLLAFTNAPKIDPAHRASAIKACIDILETNARKQTYYRDKWRTEFNVRIGIETGYATVGFFPSKLRGTYTALGDTVNLASRLCSRAKKNSICITKQFAIEIGKQIPTLDLERIGITSDIKGFEGELLDLYSIKAIKTNMVESPNHLCSLCSATMIEESVLGESILLQCPACGYRDLIEQTAYRNAA